MKWSFWMGGGGYLGLTLKPLHVLQFWIMICIITKVYVCICIIWTINALIGIWKRAVRLLSKRTWCNLYFICAKYQFVEKEETTKNCLNRVVFDYSTARCCLSVLLRDSHFLTSEVNLSVLFWVLCIKLYIRLW